MAGCGGRRPNMEEEAADMAGCGEQPGDNWFYKDMESVMQSVEALLAPAVAHQGPESSDDHSAAHPKESPEHSPEKNRGGVRTVFTEVQLNTLKASFDKEQIVSPTEMNRLVNLLSLPERTIQTWFTNRRRRMWPQSKLAYQWPESSDDRSAAHPKESPESSPEKNRGHGRTVFTEVQLNTLKASFNEEHYLTPTEMNRLVNLLSLPERTIQNWFINRRTRERNRKKFGHQGPESSDDHRATRVYEKVFTEAQLNILKTLFKGNHYLTTTEGNQLENQWSVSQQTIQKWFKNQRKKLRHQPPNSHPESKYQSYKRSTTPIEDQLDFLHMQNTDSTINVVQAQHWSDLDGFPPPQPMDSCVSPQGPHSSVIVYCQNVVGPPDSCCGTEVNKMLPESGHELPNDFLLNLSLQNYTIKPETSVLTPVPPVTTCLTSYDGPSTSSAPKTLQMPIVPYTFNLPGTSIWTTESCITTNLTSYDGTSTSSAPCTSQPVAWYNTDDRRSTVTTPLIDDETTDSD